MGWSNYIIISEWKMMIETSRNVNELEDYIANSLDYIVDEDNIGDDVDMANVKLSELTLGNLAILLNSHTNMSAIVCTEPDKLFLYWLEGKDIKYEIKSEYNIDLKKYKEDGYKIISRWKSDNDKDDENDEKTVDDSN